MPDDSASLPDAPQSLAAEPYRSTESTDESASMEGSVDRRFPSLRLIFAVVLVGLMWLVLIVPGKIAPMTFLHFLSMQGGPLLALLLLTIWWFALPRISWRDRLVGWGIAIATVVFTFMASDPSMPIIVLVFLVPIALTVLVSLLAVTAGVAWPRRGWISLAGFVIPLLGSLLFRAVDTDATFHFGLAARWSPDAEERFMAELQTQSGPAADVDVSLPEEPREIDWAEFRGPQRDSRIAGVRFSSDWNANPPQELWRRKLGPGWSSFCVIGSMVVTQEQREQKEIVSAYVLDSGEPLWTNEAAARFTASMGGTGPRATPTYRSGQVFVTGAAGLIQCLDAKSGETVWRFHLVEDFGAPLPMWGFANSPLVADDLVFVFAGGGKDRGVVALDRQSGELAWSAGRGSHSYSSPQLSQIDGVSQVLMASNYGLQAFDPQNGELLWQHEWNIGEMARVTQPLVNRNTVYLGTGYGNGTRRLDVKRDGDSWAVEEGWTSQLKPYFNDFVYHDGSLYGFDGDIFMSIDAETGDKNWKRGRYGNGQVLLLADMGMLLVMTEKGKVLLVNADSNKHKEIAELDALKGVTWNHPVIVDGKLLVRNAEEMACYQLPMIENAVDQ